MGIPMPPIGMRLLRGVTPRVTIVEQRARVHFVQPQEVLIQLTMT